MPKEEVAESKGRWL